MLRNKYKSIGVGTGGATGPWPPHFSDKINLEIFPFFLKHHFYTENDSPERGKHTNLRRNASVERLAFTRDEIEASLAPSLWVTLLRPCIKDVLRAGFEPATYGCLQFPLQSTALPTELPEDDEPFSVVDLTESAAACSPHSRRLAIVICNLS